MRLSVLRNLMPVVAMGSFLVLAGCQTTEVKPGEAAKPQAAAKEAAPASADVATGYQPIQSDLIYSATYDAANSVMTLVLYEDGVMDYQGVPRSVYDAFLKSKDRDDFYRKKIQPAYKGEKFNME